jgi:hypothetical protein
MEDKRTVCGLEVPFAMHVGDREVLFLLDPKSDETPFLVGYRTAVPELGLEQVDGLVGGDDYLEAVDEFLCRVQEQVTQVRADREMSDEPQEVFGASHCLPDGMKHHLEGRVVILKPEGLRHEYRNAAHQLIYITGGFGALPAARGQTVYGNAVFTGDKFTYRRHQVLGVLDPAKAPNWVQQGVKAIRAQQKTKSKGGNRGC